LRSSREHFFGFTVQKENSGTEGRRYIVSYPKRKIQIKVEKEVIFGVQKEQFLSILRDELTARGIPAASAGQYVQHIAQTLSASDIAEIESIQDTADVAKLAQGIVMIKQRSDAKKTPAAPVQKGASPAPVRAADDGDVKVYGGNSVKRPPAASVVEDEVDYSEYVHDDDPEPLASAKGKRTFWLIFVCALPLTLLLLLAYFGLFGACFAALCALIILLIAGLIGGVAVGAVVSFVGIVYGITQLITAASQAPGLYEIGLGITVGGIVMAGGIIVYNIAIRLIPLLIRLLASLFRLCTGKLRTLYHMAKEACYKL